jgi:flagellar biosynthesis protein FlhF
MRLKIFRAAALTPAIAQIRRELGPDALILNTRRINGGVEVTAALEAKPPQYGNISNSTKPQTAREALICHGVPPRLLPPATSQDMEAFLAAMLRLDRLDFTIPVLVAGPPGVGKTLSIVRLATRMVLAGNMPMVVTADGARAGATEELAAFTRLLGIKLHVAASPIALSRAITNRPTKDGPVLIDMQGSNPLDPLESTYLKAFASAAQAQLVAVLAAGTDAEEAIDMANALRAAGSSRLIATKLDVSRRLGAVVAAGTILNLAELGIGSGAADGMTVASHATLSAHIDKFGHIS